MAKSIDIIGPQHAMVGREVDYTVIPGEAMSYHWQVAGGEILEGQDTPAIRVRWEEGEEHHVKVHIQNHGMEVEKSELAVQVDRRDRQG